MAVFKRNGEYWIDIYVKGKRVRRKIGPDRQIAELVVQDLKVKAAKGEYLGITENRKIRFEVFALKEYLPWCETTKSATTAYAVPSARVPGPVLWWPTHELHQGEGRGGLQDGAQGSGETSHRQPRVGSATVTSTGPSSGSRAPIEAYWATWPAHRPATSGGVPAAMAINERWCTRLTDR